MNLDKKLYNLFLKMIDKIDKREQIDDKSGWTVEYREGTDKYFISIKQSIDSIQSARKVYKITFQDLEANLNEEEYNDIVSKIKDKIRIFVEIEEEKKKRQQEIIVDRLLEKLKK